MDQEKLGIGKLIESPQERDAIHIAVAPVVATLKLHPGQPVSVKDGKAYRNLEVPIGVVDPFLKSPVYEDEKFWVFLYPGSITSLRHDWIHPSFQVQPAQSERVATSIQWLTDFAQQNGLDYEGMLDVVSQNFSHTGNAIWVDDLFWMHYETATGNTTHEKTTYFSCGC